MKNFKLLLMAVAFLASTAVFAQTKLSGKVVDETNQPLPGASIVVKGTSTGTSSDFDGKFALNTNVNTGAISISFVGYETKTVNFNGTTNFQTIALVPSAESLDEVVITGVADIAKERQTPVAVSTIRAEEIVETLGTKEFPEILNTTPSVYATKQGGGFGDARINIRGFDQRNTAVMINGMPVNDMENGWVYWSNWAGLSDVTTAMQVQRGLGSSKLAISSVGGTINVLTRAADKAQGGTVSVGVGNDNYLKTLISYNTGKLDNGLSVSALFGRSEGDGFVDGTEFEGYSYYLALDYRPNDNHDFQFTVTGAPQQH
ncbi:MAG TPA: carboxypeptidase-like regulatory domain-containing protein, partial [Flavobacteriaceae bacterium]|nr:carboxypeptidase-like regulatory domain-containing protein [Flavobacteriaceae bacterium]